MAYLNDLRMVTKRMDKQSNNDRQTVPYNSVIDSSSTADEFVSRKINELLEQGAFRKKTLEIIEEHTNSVPFMEKVQKYADQQIDNRLFKNVKVVVGLIIGWLVSIGLAVLIAWLTNKPQ